MQLNKETKTETKYSYICNTNKLHTVVWFQVFQTFIWFQEF